MAALTDVSLGLANETTYGTFATPTRWYEDAGADLGFEPNRVQGQGLRVGSRLARSNRRVTTTKSGGGPTPVEAQTKGMGLLYESMLGNSSSALVSGTTYQQLFTLENTPLLPSRTLQTGVVRTDGTVDAISYLGCTVASWSISLDNAGILMVTPTWDVRDVTTAQSYGTPTHTTGGQLYSFEKATLAIGGTVTAPTSTAMASGGTTVTNVLDFSIEGDNNLKTDRYAIGNAGLKSQPTTGVPSITGSMTIEYDSTTMRDAFLADTELALLLSFTSTEALSTGFAQLQIVLPAIKLNGDLPKGNGGDLIELDVDFDVLDNLTATQGIWIAQRTADSAV